MNPKCLSLILFLILLLNHCLLGQTESVKTSLSNGPKLSIKANKEDHVIGEPVFINISLINAPQDLLQTKTLCLLDAAPGNGVFKFCGAIIKPAKKPEVSEPNDLKEYLGQFQEYTAGKYHVRAEIRDTSLQGVPLYQAPLLFASDIVEITLHQPTGTDAQAWKKLQENPEFLMFYKLGYFHSWQYGSPKATAALEELSKFANDYPSVYSERIKKLIADYRPPPQLEE